MRRRRNMKVDACFCDECSKVCDSSCRAEAFHDAQMLTTARLRGMFARTL